MLLLRELGIPKLIYEELYTNPKLRTLIKVFGDVLYMVGGSIVGAAIYAYFVEVKLYLTVLIIGIIFIVIGSYLKRE
ncbi:hypothetical protein [Malaciobacter mytili]|nr:hypothetical protein [Malaciobacter mytili]